VRPDSAEEFIAVDVGESRVGLARGSSLARIAEPLKTVAAKDALKELKAAIQALGATGVVVGLPRGLSGQETPQTRSVKSWAQKAKTEITLPFYWQDEALTSREAAAKLQNPKFKFQIADEHSLAAAIILQDFLDMPTEGRIRV